MTFPISQLNGQIWKSYSSHHPEKTWPGNLDLIFLVVWTPLKKDEYYQYNIWKKKTCSKPPTSFLKIILRVISWSFFYLPLSCCSPDVAGQGTFVADPHGPGDLDWSLCGILQGPEERNNTLEICLPSGTLRIQSPSEEYCWWSHHQWNFRNGKTDMASNP